MHASKARRSRSGGNWCQPPTGLVFSQPYLHQAAPKHSRDRRLLKSDLGRLYHVIVSYISNFVFACYIVLYTLYDYSKTYVLYIYIRKNNKHVINYSSIWFLILFSQGHRVGVATFFAAFCRKWYGCRGSTCTTAALTQACQDQFAVDPRKLDRCWFFDRLGESQMEKAGGSPV